MQALLAAVDACWASPVRCHLTGRRHSAPGEHLLDEYLVVPSSKRPWLALPAGNPPAASASIRRFTHALSMPRRAARLALSAVVRVGLADLVVPDRIAVTAPVKRDVGSVQELLGSVLGEAVTVSLGVGAPRANRKPVLQVMSRRGRVLAFAKLGHDDVTRGLLRGEAEALRQLAERPIRGLTTPRLEHYGNWQDVDVLVQSALPTHVLPARRRATMPTAAIRAFTAAFDEGERPATASPLWDGLVAAVGEIGDATQRDRFADVLARTGQRLREVSLRHSAWHGDWTPWNMSWGRDAISIWDWERFATGAPVGLDALHYAGTLHAAAATWPNTLTWIDAHAADVTGPVGVPRRHADAVVTLYLLDLCRRYLLAAQPPTGVALRPRGAQLLDHLTARQELGVISPQRTT